MPAVQAIDILTPDGGDDSRQTRSMMQDAAGMIG